MRDLFRQASYLFWQYPSLWAPVALADLLSYGLNQLYLQAVRWLTFGFFAQRSVLSKVPDPIKFTSGFLTIGFVAFRAVITLSGVIAYAAALAAVSISLIAYIEGRSISAREVLSAMTKRHSTILGLGLKVFGAGAVAIVLESMLYIYPFPLLRHFLTGWNYSCLLAALGIAATAWLIAPAAFSALGSRPVDHISRLRARHAAFLCIASSSALFYLSREIRFSFLQSSTPAALQHAYWMVTSSLAAVPYTFLFILLHLLAHPESAQQISLEPFSLPSEPSPLPPSTAE